MSEQYERGDVVRGPDLFTNYAFRPYVRLSDETHPFHDEGLYAATATERPDASAPTEGDFTRCGLPRTSYVNPWTVVSIRHADVDGVEGTLVTSTTERIAREATRYLGVEKSVVTRVERLRRRPVDANVAPVVTDWPEFAVLDAEFDPMATAVVIGGRWVIGRRDEFGDEGPTWEVRTADPKR